MCAAHHKQRKSAVNLSHAEKIARREEAIVRIREMLAVRRRTVIDMAAEMNIPWNTVYGYMRFMQEVGDAHPTGEFAQGRREFWAAGRGKPREGAAAPDCSQRRAIVKPAQQVGMARDALVAALFGPAPSAA